MQMDVRNGKAFCRITRKLCDVTGGQVPEDWDGCAASCDRPIEHHLEQRAEMHYSARDIMDW